MRLFCIALFVVLAFQARAVMAQGAIEQSGDTPLPAVDDPVKAKKEPATRKAAGEKIPTEEEKLRMFCARQENLKNPACEKDDSE